MIVVSPFVGIEKVCVLESWSRVFANLPPGYFTETVAPFRGSWLCASKTLIVRLFPEMSNVTFMSRSIVRSAVFTNCVKIPIDITPITRAMTNFIGTPISCPCSFIATVIRLELGFFKEIKFVTGIIVGSCFLFWLYFLF